MYNSERDWALADEQYEENRMEQLDFIQNYFVKHVYKINADISGSSNCKSYKKGESGKYEITLYLKPKGTLKLEIPIESYEKVNKVVSHYNVISINDLKYEDIDKVVDLNEIEK